MSETAEKLKAELLALPESDRWDMLWELHHSLLGPPGVLSEDDPEFDAILDRRLADHLSGRVKGIPGDEVMDRLKKKFAR